MKELLEELRDKLSAAKSEVTKFNEAIKAIQNTCEHDWCYEGHGHNDAYYKCKVCGAEERR